MRDRCVPSSRTQFLGNEMCSPFIRHFCTLIPKTPLTEGSLPLPLFIYMQIKILAKSFSPLREDFDCGDGTKDKPLRLVLEMPQVERFLMKWLFSTCYMPDLLGVGGTAKGSREDPLSHCLPQGKKRSVEKKFKLWKYCAWGEFTAEHWLGLTERLGS